MANCPFTGINNFSELLTTIKTLQTPNSSISPPFGSNEHFLVHEDNKDFVEFNLKFKGIKNFLYFFRKPKTKIVIASPTISSQENSWVKIAITQKEKIELKTRKMHKQINLDPYKQKISEQRAKIIAFRSGKQIPEILQQQFQLQKDQKRAKQNDKQKENIDPEKINQEMEFSSSNDENIKELNIIQKKTPMRGKRNRKKADKNQDSEESSVDLDEYDQYADLNQSDDVDYYFNGKDISSTDEESNPEIQEQMQFSSYGRQRKKTKFTDQ
ncbi:MAG: hypothetical protein EZS28_009387 [Streblomastix strix]|uniref:Uncharacterized protein n=1 Tax=Streblomastix strix TaxID=222440 RepID=A0A5J4WJ21_9EUKA|nr:MAG: hypothetical protein EZS28_009387 [Streblomastix strix]